MTTALKRDALYAYAQKLMDVGIEVTAQAHVEIGNAVVGHLESTNPRGDQREGHGQRDTGAPDTVCVTAFGLQSQLAPHTGIQANADERMPTESYHTPPGEETLQ